MALLFLFQNKNAAVLLKKFGKNKMAPRGRKPNSNARVNPGKKKCIQGGPKRVNKENKDVEDREDCEPSGSNMNTETTKCVKKKPKINAETGKDKESKRKCGASSDRKLSGSRTKHRKQTKSCKSRGQRDYGYIYIMQDKPGRFKVGSAKCAQRRLRTFQTGNVDMKLLHAEPVSDHRNWREKQVHNAIPREYHYADPNVGSSEWFTGCTFGYLRKLVKRYASKKYPAHI